MNDLIVIGAGPAGMMAAYAANSRGIQTTLLEKNEKIGKKLFITGKGRCNLTNDCEISDFFSHIVHNPKFLMSALNTFSNVRLVSLMNENGLPTKVERGGRVFPQSERSNDVIRTLERMMQAAGVTLRLNCAVEKIRRNREGFTLTLADGTSMTAGAVIIATGGKAYPLTGSTGDGYAFAQQFKHSIVPPQPALVPLEDMHHICPKMQGLALKNVAFTLFQDEKSIYSEQGELIFTHFGISGPVVLSASSFINHKKDVLNLRAEIDLKPALSIETLDARLVREFEANSNKQLKNVMHELMPGKLIHPFLQESGLDPDKAINSITKAERAQLAYALKHFSFMIADTRPIEEGIVTAGGIVVREINPSTMESKLVPNLYFAGEIIDVDAQTGGFNLQIAFSTGFLAGSSVFN
ncbi:MAG: NAD(P)/FAD-dependent oxidoreductase [Christensenella sp.]